jgi:hypothetical protein
MAGGITRPMGVRRLADSMAKKAAKECRPARGARRPHANKGQPRARANSQKPHRVACPTVFVAPLQRNPGFLGLFLCHASQPLLQLAQLPNRSSARDL